MTALGRREPRFSDITRVTNLGTKFYAMAGIRQTVVVASNVAGLTTVVGETADLGAQPRDIASNGSNKLFILTDEGLKVTSIADTPVVSATYEFDPGDGRWVFYTGGYVVTPCEGGVRVTSQTDGSHRESWPSTGEGCAGAALSADDILYVVDGKKSRIHVFRILDAIPVYVDSFRAPNCRDVVRVVLDEAAEVLYVMCKRRIVSFSVPNSGAEDSDIAVDKIQDVGQANGDYTDMVAVDGGLWIGIDEDTPFLVTDEFYGRQYAAWDAANDSLIVACPDYSYFAASNVVPYVDDIAEIEDVVDEVDEPEVVLPPAPVITSTLTASLTEDTLFAYTITATGAGPITFGVTSPPSWLTSINPLTGAIAGTPTDPGSVNVFITATNSGGTTTATLVVTVLSAIGDNTGAKVLGAVEGVAWDGALLYIVGSFTQVTDAVAGTITRNRAACLNTATGQWTSWNPNISATSYAVHVHAGHVYVGTRTAAPTFGGVAVSYAARTDPTTGVRDATWAPTFNGTVRCFATGSTGRLFVGGAFTTVSAGTRIGICSFTNTTLDSWAPAASDGNTFVQFNGFGTGDIQVIAVSSGRVLYAAGVAGRVVRTAGGNWSLSWGWVDETTGVVGQAADGTGGNLQGIEENVAFLDSSGRLVYTYTATAGGTAINTLPGGAPDTGKDLYFVSRVTSSGANVAAANLGVPSGNFGGVVERADGNYIVAGSFDTTTAQAAYGFAVSYHPTTGVIDTGFTFKQRMNGTATGTTQPFGGAALSATGLIAAIYGNVGSVGGNHQYDGATFQGLVLVNPTTGARY